MAILFFVLVVAAQPVWGARAQLATISADPYVSALLIDGATGEVLFSENAEKVVYPASVVKLMDLLIMLDRIREGKNSLEEMVPVTVEAAKTGGSQVYLDPKEQFSVDDLLYALMVQSANDAAVALAMHVAGSKEGFVAMMNQKAAELGMKDTRFHSVHGLPPSAGQEVDQTTASDLALLGRALVVRPEALRYTATRVRDFRDGKFIMRNHNHLLDQVDGCDGLKTGYFQAGGFSIAATAARGDNRVIAIVMGSRDRKVRDARAGQLLNEGLAQLATRPPSATAASTVSASRQQQESGQPATASPEPVEKAPAAAAAAEAVEGGGAILTFWKPFLLGLMAGILISGVAIWYILRRRRVRLQKDLIRRV